MDLSVLPAVNAALNGAASVLLVIGVVLIKRRQTIAHRRVMISAFVASCFFMVGYVTHYIWRAQVMGGAHTPYHGAGLMRKFYYAMLISHIVLAASVPVFAIVLIRLGSKRRYAAHRKVARIGWPIWMYVSLTGVLIYFMLHHWNPTGDGA